MYIFREIREVMDLYSGSLMRDYFHRMCEINKGKKNPLK